MCVCVCVWCVFRKDDQHRLCMGLVHFSLWRAWKHLREFCCTFAGTACLLGDAAADGDMRTKSSVSAAVKRERECV